MELNEFSWKSIQDEYKQARHALEQLVKQEEGSLREQAEELIINLDQHYNKLHERVDRLVAIDYSLTAPLPPPVDRHNLKGFLAYRAWDMQVKGSLSPSISWVQGDAWTNEVAFADEPPSRDNHHGLHATRLENWENNRYSKTISGLVDLYGAVIEHEDGVMRAECARIICLFIEVTGNNQIILLTTGLHDLLRKNYPNVPVYPVSPYQKKLILWREVLVNYRAIPTIIEMNRERRSIW